KIKFLSAICFENGESFMEKLANDKKFSPPFGPVKLYKVELQGNAIPALLAENIWLGFELRPHYMGTGKYLQNIIFSPDQSKALLRTFTHSIPIKLKDSYRQTNLYKHLKSSN